MRRAILSHRAEPSGRTTMPRSLVSLADGIDRVTAAVGRAAAWCCVFIVLAEFAVVVMRYVFGVGWIGLQESVLYAHAALFMLAAAWTLQVGGHVRVDIFYAQAKPRTQGAGRSRRRVGFSHSLRRRAGAGVCSLCRALVGHHAKARARRAGCRSFISSRASFRCLPFSSACKGWRRRSAPRASCSGRLPDAR